MLNPAQKKYLRGLAHSLKPLVLIGGGGVTPSLLASVEEALEGHELIKIRFNDHKEQKKELLEKITQETGSEAAGMIGHVATLYRSREEPEKRKIFFPGEKPPKKTKPSKTVIKKDR
ncbi:MAG: ribosome assembly RNA-binding protein YhbY [Magnetococcales bacterium]|nr:ribosome assembly RNA-binding protein YhbY [Magnetococcales bacterium]